MRVRFALPGAPLLLLGSYAIGQEITATILGSVTDASVGCDFVWRFCTRRLSAKLHIDAPKTYC